MEIKPNLSMWERVENKEVALKKHQNQQKTQVFFVNFSNLCNFQKTKYIALRIIFGSDVHAAIRKLLTSMKN